MQDFEAWLYGGAVNYFAMIQISHIKVSPASTLGVSLACARTYNLELRTPIHMCHSYELIAYTNNHPQF